MPRAPIVPKICLYCGQEFRAAKPYRALTQVYCNRACMAADYATRQRGVQNTAWQTWITTQELPVQLPLFFGRKKRRRVTARRLCHVCFCPFLPRKGNQRFCPTCGYITIPCVICSTPFRKHRTNRKYTCSAPCKRAWISQRQQGEKSHRWQGGKTSQMVLLRTSVAYKTWRQAVFLRDDFTCALCATRGGKLAAHHIVRVKEAPARMFEIDNGITLCWDCHRSIHWKEESYAAQFTAHILGGHR